MKIGLGSVQFGLSYGVSNKQGKTSLNEVKKILEFAEKNNLSLIDTAPLYGKSEEVLGKALADKHPFRITTKTPYFNSKIITNREIESLTASVENSFENLNQKQIYGIFFHNTDDIFCKKGEQLFSKLREFKKNKLIEKIGFSVYNPSQIDKLLNNFDLDIVQLPINILDQKLLIDGYLDKLKNKNIEIHARSVFLQGLLLMPLEKIPSYFNPIKISLQKYFTELKIKNITPLQAALNFAKKINQIDHIILGINNVNQLSENIKAYSTTIASVDFGKYNCNNEKITNPKHWTIR